MHLFATNKTYLTSGVDFDTNEPYVSKIGFRLVKRYNFGKPIYVVQRYTIRTRFKESNFCEEKQKIAKAQAFEAANARAKTMNAALGGVF